MLSATFVLKIRSLASSSRTLEPKSRTESNLAIPSHFAILREPRLLADRRALTLRYAVGGSCCRCLLLAENLLFAGQAYGPEPLEVNAPLTSDS